MYLKKTLYDSDFEFCLIENFQQLKNFCEQIIDGDVIAIDTEFTRRVTYYPILSTIQIALKKTNQKKILALIDVVSCKDITIIINIINNVNIVKIFHSSLQDLQIFHKISQKIPQNIFDTQIMANFCQQNANIGYSSLVKNLFSVDICKKMQNSDWQSRPLNQSQIDYAIVDVLFLHEIYENFCDILKSSNQHDWLIEEMQNFVDKIFKTNSNNLLKSFNVSKFDKITISRLNNLLLLREKYAKIYNLPREHLIKNDDLLNIVNLKNDLTFYKNLPTDFAQEISSQLNDIDEITNLDFPIKLTAVQKNYLDKIKSLISKIAKKYQFSEQFLLNNNQIKNIVINNNVKNLINGWRYQIMGNQIEQILFTEHENNHRKLENESRL
jgi:ribonuclease D